MEARAPIIGTGEMARWELASNNLTCLSRWIKQSQEPG